MSATSSVWADPTALDQFAGGSAGRTRQIQTAKATMIAAVSAWNRADNEQYGFCLDTFGDDVDDLARGWVMTDDFVSQVAQAFREADGPAPSTGIVFTQEGTINRSMAANLEKYNPVSSISEGDVAEWERLTGAKISYKGGKYGGGGFIIAPDGKRYPLVVPETNDGKNADDGGPGDVSTLDGSDPGWFRVNIYDGERSLYPTDKTSAAIGGALAGLTGGPTLPNKSASPGEYANLYIDADGRPKFSGSGKVPFANKGGIDKLRDLSADSYDTKSVRPVNPTPTPAAAKGLAGLFAVNSFVQGATAVNNAEKDSYGKYQLITERNLDGRVRARLTVFQLWKGNPDGKAVIIPSGISASDGRLRQTLIHYRPHSDIGDPAHDTDLKGDHILKGIKDESLLGLFGSWKAPTFQDK